MWDSIRYCNTFNSKRNQGIIHTPVGRLKLKKQKSCCPSNRKLTCPNDFPHLTCKTGKSSCYIFVGPRCIVYLLKYDYDNSDLKLVISVLSFVKLGTFSIMFYTTNFVFVFNWTFFPYSGYLYECIKADRRLYKSRLSILKDIFNLLETYWRNNLNKLK